MASLVRWALSFGRRKPWTPKDFGNVSFPRIKHNVKIEEETLPDYKAARYYPVHIGQVFETRYQVVGKLGFGTSSTVWLARDLAHRRHVALKVFIRSQSLRSIADHEVAIYKRLDKGHRTHPGRNAVRTMTDSFNIDGPDGQHVCIVHPPLWDSVKTLLERNPVRRLPIPVVAIVLQRIFLALSYLRQCRIIHTDIKADNIMFSIEDSSIFQKFEDDELQNPSPRKEVDGRTIYVSRELEIPSLDKIGPPVLCDFGSAVFGDELHTEDVQPDVYRSPEVILKVPWDYRIDIWNTGCMIWDIFEGRHLFYGQDIEAKAYRGRTHLAEIIALIGPPPVALLARGSCSSKFFSDDGTFTANASIPEPSLETLETNLTGHDQELFIRFVRKMLQWAPEDRTDPDALVNDEWLQKALITKYKG